MEVNEDNIKNFTIYDVVMPIPGNKIEINFQSLHILLQFKNTVWNEWMNEICLLN